MQTRVRRAFDWFFRDQQGRVVIWQMPNVPLWTWVASVVVGYVAKRGAVHEVISAVGTAALVVWALMEAYSGVNPFRRTLGAAVLVYLTASRLSG